LKEEILKQLPELLKDVEAGIVTSQKRLHQLGASRTNFPEQRRYVHQISDRFSALMKSAVDGVYSDSFFGSAETKEGEYRRLRAVVQNILTRFSQTMRTKGCTHSIIEEPKGEMPKRAISRADYAKKVRQIMRRSRGCELPGTFNPLIIGELFREQCQPWEEHAIKARDEILDAVHIILNKIMDYSMVPETAGRISQLINRGIDILKLDLDQKLAQILEPHTYSHPITYNHYLTENVQKAQEERQQRSLKAALESNLAGGKLNSGQLCTINPEALLVSLNRKTELNMEAYASDFLIDYMQAYYKVCYR
jgi:hypothetical protein